MSSRNVYLSPDDRLRALALSRALRHVAARFDDGERDGARLARAGREVLDAVPGVAVDYFAVADGETLEPAVRAGPGALVMVAARVGATRLIDNVVLGDRP
jgi:pantoate--beta-alanine ligase